MHTHTHTHEHTHMNTHSCGVGMGMALWILEAHIVLLDTTDLANVKGCTVTPPYLDEYGEPDPGLRCAAYTHTHTRTHARTHAHAHAHTHTHTHTHAHTHTHTRTHTDTLTSHCTHTHTHTHRRGNPLKLNEESYQELRQLWFQHRIPERICKEMEGNRGLMRVNWSKM